MEKEDTELGTTRKRSALAGWELDVPIPPAFVEAYATCRAGIDGRRVRPSPGSKALRGSVANPDSDWFSFVAEPLRGWMAKRDGGNHESSVGAIIVRKSDPKLPYTQ